MRSFTKLPSVIKNTGLPKGVISPFNSFAVIIMFITLGDALMAYTVPIYLDNVLHNTFLMGLVMATSSSAGLLLDFLVSKKFRTKNYKYFMHATFIFAILFPVTLLFLPSYMAFIVMAMAFWGIYFETKIYAEFHFIDRHVPRDEYSKSWGLVSVLNSSAYFFGSLIATLIISYSLKFTFAAALILFGLTYLIFSLLAIKSESTKPQTFEENSGNSNLSFRQTFQVWRTLMGKIWPLWTFNLVITLVDAAFWTVGIIFSEQMRGTHPAGGLIITAYMFPPIFMGFLLPKITARLGKKKTAFISALFAATFVLLFGLASNVYLLIFLVFSGSVLLSIANPALYAAYEDYVSRLGKFNNDMIGLEQTASSVGYVIGPLLAGAIAATAGVQQTFVFTGALLLVTSVVCLIVVPRKIRMPQKELVSDLF